MAIANPWAVTLRVKEVQQQVHAAARQALQDTFALDIVPDAVRMSPVSPTNPKIVGTKYKDTGHNRRSIDFVIVDTPEGPKALIFTQSGYGGWLEIGTSKMIARPYIFPAFQLNIGKYAPAMGKQLLLAA